MEGDGLGVGIDFLRQILDNEHIAVGGVHEAVYSVSAINLHPFTSDDVFGCREVVRALHKGAGA